MSPEEAGLNVPEGQSVLKQPFLRPKTEPLSDNSDLDSDENDTSSDNEEDSSTVNRPYKWTQKNPSNNPVLHPSSVPSIRTKAARKQLPFNVVITDRKVNKLISGCNSPLKSEGERTERANKANSSKTNLDGKSTQNQGKIVSATESSDTSEASDESNSHIKPSAEIGKKKLKSSKNRGAKQNLQFFDENVKKSKAMSNTSQS